MTDSLKNQAEHTLSSIEQDLQQMEKQPTAEQNALQERVDNIMGSLMRVISDVDLDAARAQVTATREKLPDADTEEIVRHLIREKCRRTGAVGAITSGTGLVPGLGTVTAVTLGVAADIGATFKLQAELVLEIADAYGHTLSDEEKQRIVLLITGLSAGSSAVARRVGQTATIKFSERFAGKAVLKAVPVLGMLAAAGTNVLSTYVIGQRADAYFRLGPEAVGDWRDSLRTLSGVDERAILQWVSDNGRATGSALGTTAGKLGQTGKETGVALTNRAISLGRKSGAVLQEKSAESRHFLGRYIIGPAWRFVTFVPRRGLALLKKLRSRRNKNPETPDTSK